MFIPFEVEYKNEDGKSMTATEELMARVKSEILENEVRLKKISEDGNILRVLQMDDKHYGDCNIDGHDNGDNDDGGDSYGCANTRHAREGVIHAREGKEKLYIHYKYCLSTIS